MSPELGRVLNLRERLALRRKNEKEAIRENEDKRYYLRRQVLDSNRPQYDFPEDYEAYARAHIEEIPERYREIVGLGLCGYDKEEVAEMLDIKPHTVDQFWSRGRKPLEEYVLFNAPLRLTRITRKQKPTPVDRMLSHAAKTQALKTQMILGVQYATDEQLSDFAEKELVVEDMQRAGYVLLNEVTTENEYDAITHGDKYQQFLVRKFGRIFIKRMDLDRILPKLRRLTTRSTTEPEYFSINDATTTKKEASAVRNAVKTGQIHPLPDEKKVFVYQPDSNDVVNKKRNKKQQRKNAITRQS